MHGRRATAEQRAGPDRRAFRLSLEHERRGRRPTRRLRQRIRRARPVRGQPGRRPAGRANPDRRRHAARAGAVAGRAHGRLSVVRRRGEPADAAPARPPHRAHRAGGRPRRSRLAGQRPGLVARRALSRLHPLVAGCGRRVAHRAARHRDRGSQRSHAAGAAGPRALLVARRHAAGVPQRPRSHAGRPARHRGATGPVRARPARSLAGQPGSAGLVARRQDHRPRGGGGSLPSHLPGRSVGTPAIAGRRVRHAPGLVPVRRSRRLSAPERLVAHAVVASTDGGEARRLGFADGMVYDHGFDAAGALVLLGMPSDHPRALWRVAPGGGARGCWSPR